MQRSINHSICALTFLLFVTIAHTIQAFQIQSTLMQLTPSQVLTCSSTSTTQFLNNPERSIGNNVGTIENKKSSSNRSKRNKSKKLKKKFQKVSLNSQNVGDETNDKSSDANTIHNTNSNTIQKQNNDSTSNSKKFDNKNKRKNKMSQSNQSESTPPKMVGNAPDIHWRAIPMKHLRVHPNFDPLPPPSQIHFLQNFTQASQFRQDSWQWQALHMGRCTTSQTAAALGLLEPNAAKCMGVPKSLWKAGSRAYDRLKEGSRETIHEEGVDDVNHNKQNKNDIFSARYINTALVGLEEMNEVLFGMEEGEDKEWGMEGINFDEDDDFSINDEGGDSVVYKGMSSKHIWGVGRYKFGAPKFAAKYLPRYNCTISESDKHAIIQRYNHTSFQVRMYWGCTQEATSILTALNYFHGLDSNIRVREIGLCMGNEILTPQQIDALKGLQVGASPDAVLVHSNGKLEALEVKNHCPFVGNVPYRNPNQKNITTHKRFRINIYESPAIVPSVYVPQLMMEMLCLGPNCRSAIMVRQTATSGAVILRLHRDDEWINEMIRLLGRFKTEFLDKNISPPRDFFWNDDNLEEQTKYRKFVAKTKRLGEEVELVERVQHRNIQRAMPERGHSYAPLFLD